MRHSRLRHLASRKRAFGAAFVLVAIAGLPACRVGSLMRENGRHELTSAEFVGDPLTAATSARALTGGSVETRVAPDATITLPAIAPTAPATPVARASTPTASPKIGAADPEMAKHLQDLASDVKLEPGSPTTSTRPAEGADANRATEPSAPREVIDAKVGEINGRAIRLSELLDQFLLGSRLQQTANEYRRGGKSRREWMEASRKLVKDQINDILNDELLVAEGLSTLTEPQKQGLLAFIAETQKNIARGAGGSIEAAKRGLQQEGLTENKVVSDERKRALIEFQLAQVSRKLRVSRREERLYYDRHYNEFNPPASVTFRVITVPAKDEAGVERVRSALAENVPFADLAKEKMNTYNRDGGGLMRTLPLESDLATAEVFPADKRFGPLNESAHTLAQGHWVGPVDLPEVRDSRGRVRDDHELAWLYLEDLRQSHRSFSDRDVQLDIFERLTTQQRTKELEAYFARLKKRASFSSLDEMADRIVDIVAERYWPVG